MESLQKRLYRYFSSKNVRFLAVEVKGHYAPCGELGQSPK